MRRNNITKARRRQLMRAITHSKTFVKAYQDLDFLDRNELRPIRLQLELLKPELTLSEHNIHSTIVVFGSARSVSPEDAQADILKLKRALQKAPHSKKSARRLDGAKNLLAHSRYYDEARKFGEIVTRSCQKDHRREFVIVTGGGPGIMEAANRGAFDAGGKSVGLAIALPKEQRPNPFVTPELCFNFRYFAIRKMHFLLRCKALVAFPGGYGTMDELFETLTLIQTGKVERFPVLLFGKDFWARAVNFAYLAEQGVISRRDPSLFAYVDTAQAAWAYIQKYWRRHGAHMPAAPRPRKHPRGQLSRMLLSGRARKRRLYPRRGGFKT